MALMHNLNYGAAFGKLDSIPWVLVVGRGIAALVLLLLVIRAGPKQGWHVLALILVFAGCMGNLWDNLTYEPLAGRAGMPFGPVRDFIDVYFAYWDWHFPTFNIADSAISMGLFTFITEKCSEPKSVRIWLLQRLICCLNTTSWVSPNEGSTGGPHACWRLCEVSPACVPVDARK